MKQFEIKLKPRERGFHLITAEVQSALAKELSNNETGLCHLFLKHTSASLTLNENADPDVRQDMEMTVSKIVPESFPYIHSAEGPDDMPAHVKTSLFGSALTIPLTNGRLNLGTWQGIYLGEHRNHGGSRSVVVTLL